LPVADRDAIIYSLKNSKGATNVSNVNWANAFQREGRMLAYKTWTRWHRFIVAMMLYTVYGFFVAWAGFYSGPSMAALVIVGYVNHKLLWEK
jgi:hypothetical protein